MSEAQNGGNVMERLTNNAWRNFDPWECCGQDKYCQRGCHDPGGCTKGCIVPQLYARLGAYEDTRLTPELVQEIAELAIWIHKNGLEKIKKWIKADKDGRLVMLPCKVGDTVWAVSGKIIKCEIEETYLCDGGGIEFLVSFNCDGADCKRCPFNNWTQDCSGECYCDCEYGNGSFKDSDIGKTIFLTREEAESALEAKRDG